jgi:hypothetical protein
MNRREFVKLAGSGVSVGALAETVVSAQAARTPAQPKPAVPKAASKTTPAAKMKLGTQQGDSEATAWRRTASRSTWCPCR